MSLELQIYEAAMRTTLRRWGAARSRDAIHDAVAEAYTRHLANARQTGKVRRELGSFVAKSAGEVLRGRRDRGAHEQASESMRGPDDNWLDPTSWLEWQGSGCEDALIELLDADPPSPLPTPEDGAAALALLLAGGWRPVFGGGPEPQVEVMQRLSAWAAKRCTGLAASWCPQCGDCKCPERELFAGDMDSLNCPLHALNSTHGVDAEEFE